MTRWRRPPLQHPLAPAFAHAVESLCTALTAGSTRSYNMVVRNFLVFLGATEMFSLTAGLIALTLQLTASLLQPLVGLYTDRRPLPYSLAVRPGAILSVLRAAERRTTPHWDPVSAVNTSGASDRAEPS